MKKLLITLFLISLHLFEVFGQSPFSAETDSLILKGIDQTFTSQFDSACSTFQKVIDRHPDHPVGYFYQAAVFQSEMMDYETDEWKQEFSRMTDQAIRLGEKRIKEGDQDPWTSFYTGSAYSYKGLYQAKTGSYIAGFISAKKGVEYLKRSVEKDSTLYDAYLGIGSYKYWAGRFYKYLRWILPWIRDERKQGIRMVKTGVEKGTFSYWVGLNSLGWIEYDRKEYEPALNLFREGLIRYPGSRFFLWGTADCTFGLRDYLKAAEIYNELLASIRLGLINNGYNETECRLKLAMAYHALGEDRDCITQCDSILSQDWDKNTARRLVKHQTTAQTLKKRCLEKLEKSE